MINYYLLTKPGIVLGNLVTVAAGFLLASKGVFHFWLFFATLVGIAFIMASACICNNYIDRGMDEKMERTKGRALVTGLISGKHALLFAFFLELIGTLILLAFTNAITVLIASFGFFVYVVLYSLWKGRTVYGTAIGSIAGAVPPVVGYTAVSNHIDAGAFILFTMLVLWQMPHFFAIALYHFDDYVAAKIPALPMEKGVLRTKIHSVLYIVGFILTASLLTFYHYTGFAYLVVTIVMGFAWLFLSIKGFSSSNDKLWGRQMFRFSLLVITALSLVIPFNTV